MRGGLSAGETGNDLGVVPVKGKALAEEPCGHLLDSIRRGRRKKTKDGSEIDIASLAMFCPYSRNCRRLAKTCSREALYGGYLHDIAHAPTLLAVVNLLLCNTEASERIQGQAKAVALACTNRRHQDIPLQVLTRLQLQSQNAERGATGISKVSKAAAALPPPPPRTANNRQPEHRGSPGFYCPHDPM